MRIDLPLWLAVTVLTLSFAAGSFFVGDRLVNLEHRVKALEAK
jgi:hypothetical protein